MDINSIIITGTIKEISEIKTLKNNQKCCWLNVFTDVSFKSKDGSIGHNKATHRVIVYGKYADVIKEKANINQKISIKGRLKTNEWEDKGTSFERTFIVLESFKLYKVKELENYEQQEEQDAEPYVEEELKFNDDPDSGYIDIDDYEDDFYLDESDLDFHFSHGLEASLNGSQVTGWDDLELGKKEE